MKIECEFCGNVINDTQARCPHCGAPNANVRRASADQPLTIDELKQWYADRGLPPAEVTRFFIGVDYKKPRAFGIYQDQNTGNFVVYKNKDNGQRAIRYEGTDEAYAVNELLQRLKQEILQQKNHPKAIGKNAARRGGILGFLLKLLLWVVGVPVVGFLILMVIGTILIAVEPKVGYYGYEGTPYYHSVSSFDSMTWYAYTQGDWSSPIPDFDLPEPLQKKRTGKPYFLQEEWDSSLQFPDFSQSLSARDLDAGCYPINGYYSYDDTWYFHLEPKYNVGWYRWNGKWEPVYYGSLPEEMQHTSLMEEHLQSVEHLRSFPVSDFRDTVYFQDYYASKNIEKGYYRLDGAVFYHLASAFDEGWYTYSEDTWTTVSPAALPEEFSHPSTVEDFYFTPVWNADTQFTDFTDTPLYRADKDNWSSSSNSSSSFDWDFSDSWDSGSSDWGSDW